MRHCAFNFNWSTNPFDRNSRTNVFRENEFVVTNPIRKLSLMINDIDPTKSMTRPIKNCWYLFNLLLRVAPARSTCKFERSEICETAVVPSLESRESSLWKKPTMRITNLWGVKRSEKKIPNFRPMARTRTQTNRTWVTGWTQWVRRVNDACHLPRFPIHWRRLCRM